ncbi:MAG: hypothetical protein RLW87_20380 [Alphaproteobacteria bacterium]
MKYDSHDTPDQIERRQRLLKEAAVGASIVVAGRVGSGTTTLLARLTACVPADRRLISLAPIPEFEIRSRNAIEIRVQTGAAPIVEAAVGSWRQPVCILLGDLAFADPLPASLYEAAAHPERAAQILGCVHGVHAAQAIDAADPGDIGWIDYVVLMDERAPGRIREIVARNGRSEAA